ncbi:Rab7a [Symbiodinium sp. KB8]|nr:Rab7a [Symbiodinium sp. KB8]
MEDAKITIDEILPVWISRENVEHFALRQAQKKAEKVQAAEARALAAENALRQLQGVWVRELIREDCAV